MKGNALAFALALLTASALPAARTFTVHPGSGAVAGAPGLTVGWGFEFVNDVNYIVFSSADYITATPIGSFTDFISLPFQVIGPGGSWTQSFNEAAQTGIGAYTIAPATPVGALSSGSLRVLYDIYSKDPNDPSFDPNSDTLETGKIFDSAVSVSVVAPIPEPSTFGFLAIGLAVAAFIRQAKGIA